MWGRIAYGLKRMSRIHEGRTRENLGTPFMASAYANEKNGRDRSRPYEIQVMTL